MEAGLISADDHAARRHSLIYVYDRCAALLGIPSDDEGSVAKRENLPDRGLF